MAGNVKPNTNQTKGISASNKLLPTRNSILGNNPQINNQTGTSYSFVLADMGNMVVSNNASSVTFTVPPNSSVNYPVGAQIDVLQLGVGQVTISPGSGVTINATPGTKIAARYSAATLIQTSANNWTLVGSLAA